MLIPSRAFSVLLLITIAQIALNYIEVGVIIPAQPHPIDHRTRIWQALSIGTVFLVPYVCPQPRAALPSLMFHQRDVCARVPFPPEHLPGWRGLTADLDPRLGDEGQRVRNRARIPDGRL